MAVYNKRFFSRLFCDSLIRYNFLKPYAQALFPFNISKYYILSSPFSPHSYFLVEILYRLFPYQDLVHFFYTVQRHSRNFQLLHRNWIHAFTERGWISSGVSFCFLNLSLFLLTNVIKCKSFYSTNMRNEI